MVNHIDLSSVLKRSVCALYSNLVTRPTGAAVRTEIELQLGQLGPQALTIIDFSHVGALDFSCADEIVAKLLLSSIANPERQDVYFVFRGMTDSHLDAIETVLERHGLALVYDRGADDVRLFGNIDPACREAWEAVFNSGGGPADEIAAAVGIPCEEASELLEDLRRRRLLMRTDAGYVAVRPVS